MRSKRVLFVQHGDTDKPGLFGDVLSEKGIIIDIVRPDLGQPLPAMPDVYAGLAFGGGEQGAYEIEKYPYLEAEKVLIRQAASQEKPVLGLCLGAQLMAAALGAEVRQADQKEIGFFPVKLEAISDYDPLWCGLPQTFYTTHWHKDVFEIPPGGMHLGRSDITPNQLFRYGHGLYGMQFHLEMTPQVLEEMVADSRDSLLNYGVDPDTFRQEGWHHLPNLKETAGTVFARWAEFL